MSTIGSVARRRQFVMKPLGGAGLTTAINLRDADANVLEDGTTVNPA